MTNSKRDIEERQVLGAYVDHLRLDEPKITDRRMYVRDAINMLLAEGKNSKNPKNPKNPKYFKYVCER